MFTLGCGEDGQRGDARPLESDQVPEEMQERHDELVEVRRNAFCPEPVLANRRVSQHISKKCLFFVRRSTSHAS